MTNRTHLAAALGWMLAAMLAPAQPLPDTYSVVATGEMGGPLSIRINRNGSKELIEWRNQSGDLHMRQLYDFQAHRLYNLDLAAKLCGIQEYVSAYAPLNFDPIGGANDLTKEMAKDPPKILRTEAVNGMKTRVAEAVFLEGKMTYWFDEKHGFSVKQTVTLKGKPERVVFEIRQITYAPSPASLFTPPPDCTPGGGVTSATGGHAEMNVDVTVQAQTDLAGAPAGKQAAQTGGAVLLGKWDFTGRNGAGAQWRGTLTIEKLEPNSFDPAKYSNTCDLALTSANSGKGVSGPCLYDPRTKTFSFAGGEDSHKYSFTAVLSPEGTSLTQSRWVEGASGDGAWSAARPRR